MKTKPTYCLFGEFHINGVFRFGGSLWIKTSTRTARLAENDRVFYFSKNERIGL